MSTILPIRFYNFDVDRHFDYNSLKTLQTYATHIYKLNGPERKSLNGTIHATVRSYGNKMTEMGMVCVGIWKVLQARKAANLISLIPGVEAIERRINRHMEGSKQKKIHTRVGVSKKDEPDPEEIRDLIPPSAALLAFREKLKHSGHTSDV